MSTYKIRTPQGIGMPTPPIGGRQRYYTADSPSMAGNATVQTTQVTFDRKTQIYAISGAGNGSTSSVASAGRDQFKFTMYRTTGDRLFTNKVIATATLGSACAPLILPVAWKLEGGESITLEFDNLTNATQVATICLHCWEPA